MSRGNTFSDVMVAPWCRSGRTTCRRPARTGRGESARTSSTGPSQPWPQRDWTPYASISCGPRSSLRRGSRRGPRKDRVVRQVARLVELRARGHRLLRLVLDRRGTLGLRARSVRADAPRDAVRRHDVRRRAAPAGPGPVRAGAGDEDHRPRRFGRARSHVGRGDHGAPRVRASLRPGGVRAFGRAVRPLFTPIHLRRRRGTRTAM